MEGLLPVVSPNKNGLQDKAHAITSINLTGLRQVLLHETYTSSAWQGGDLLIKIVGASSYAPDMINIGWNINDIGSQGACKAKAIGVLNASVIGYSIKYKKTDNGKLRIYLVHNTGTFGSYYVYKQTFTAKENSLMLESSDDLTDAFTVEIV